MVELQTNYCIKNYEHYYTYNIIMLNRMHRVDGNIELMSNVSVVQLLFAFALAIFSVHVIYRYRVAMLEQKNVESKLKITWFQISLSHIVRQNNIFRAFSNFC
jgi:hypothetical protein